MSTYIRLIDYKSGEAKEEGFFKPENRLTADQANFSKIPGSPIAYWVSERVIEVFEENPSLTEFAQPRKGNSTSNNAKFLRFWAELNKEKIGISYTDIDEFLINGKRWLPYNKGGGSRKWYGYNEYLIDWKDNAKEIRQIPTSVITNEHYYMKPGLTWSTVSSKGFGIRYFNEGYIFDNGGCCLFELGNRRDYIAGLMNTNIFTYLLGELNPTLNFQSGEISKFPVIVKPIDNSIPFNNYEISKSDWDSRETSWDFEASPLIEDLGSLKDAYDAWKERATGDFFQLHANEEELNRIFIDIYGLVDELTPDVPLKDITILQEELDRNELDARNDELLTNKTGLPIKKDVVIKQLLSYAMGCFMGRYRLDKPGLNIAHPNPTEVELSTYSYNNHPFEIDEDAIIPMMGSDSPFSDDIVFRVKELIQLIWGEDTLTENLNFINECLDEDLEKYLTKKFWNDHKKTYKKKPIYWLFGSPDKSFQVIVYMHRMNRFTIQKIRNNYLLKYLIYLNTQINRMEGNEASLTKNEAKRLDTLRIAQMECREYDKLVKDYADRQIEFDLDDGVTVNHAKFEGIVAKI